jgi:hypothetical protein
MGRKIGNRPLRTKFVVLGDGQTEQYYLKHLKEIKGYDYSIRPRFFNSITIELAESIIDELITGGCDRIVYITDYDTIVKQKKLSKYIRIIKKYRKLCFVLICESMPSIEFWFLLHYVKTTKIFMSADEVIIELKKQMPEFSKQRTFLENSRWVEDLLSDGKLEVAKQHASEILTEKENGNVGDFFPYTKVGIGMEWFENRNNKKGEI